MDLLWIFRLRITVQICRVYVLRFYWSLLCKFWTIIATPRFESATTAQKKQSKQKKTYYFVSFHDNWFNIGFGNLTFESSLKFSLNTQYRILDTKKLTIKNIFKSVTRQKNALSVGCPTQLGNRPCHSNGSFD